jgi:hypothetical protein
MQLYIVTKLNIIILYYYYIKLLIVYILVARHLISIKQKGHELQAKLSTNER